jgi:hypothetical protein
MKLNKITSLLCIQVFLFLTLTSWKKDDDANLNIEEILTGKKWVQIKIQSESIDLYGQKIQEGELLIEKCQTINAALSCTHTLTL